MTNHKLRIIYGVNDFLVGGMQQQLAEQLQWLDRTRFEPIVITLLEFPQAGTMYDRLPSDVPIYRLRFRGMFDFASWRKLDRLLKELEPDIVVSSLFFANTVFRVLAFRRTYRTIAREHNTNVERPWWQRRLNRFLALRGEHPMVAVSATVADFTARHEGIPRRRFAVITNGIDAARVTARLATLPTKTQLQKEMGIPPGSTVLLSVARLVPQKNHALLLDGFARVSATHPHVRLHVVGDGPLKSALQEKVVQLCLEEIVTFHGHQDEVNSFYKMADVFVSTSVIEGFSNALLEALAVGLPVVVTRTGGADTVIQEGKNGFFIESQTPEAVAAALCACLATDRLMLGANALATAASFDVRQSVRQYERLFERTVQ